MGDAGMPYWVNIFILAGLTASFLARAARGDTFLEIPPMLPFGMIVTGLVAYVQSEDS